MMIEPATAQDVAYVAERMRTADADEFLALAHAPDRAALAESLVARYGAHPATIVARTDDGPIAIGAGVEARPNVVTLLFFATDKFPVVALGLTRFITRNLFSRYREAGVHRIEAVSSESHRAAHRWIRALGLQQEAVFPGYGRGGETFIQFAWVADHARSPGP